MNKTKIIISLILLLTLCCLTTNIAIADGNEEIPVTQAIEESPTKVETKAIKTELILEKVYKPETNTVIATVKSNVELQPTKISWKLSADRKQYTFEFNSNTKYTTNFVDVNGNVIPLEIDITEVRPTVKLEKVYKPETNTVIATMVSNHELQDTKKSWELSPDKKRYTFEFNANTTYTTTVTDIYGHTVQVEINITEVKDKIEIEPKVYLVKKYQEETNTVIATIISNVELQNTKQSWKLSADKKQYTFEFNANTTYTTTVTDINGNVIPVEINITEVLTGPAKVRVEYKQNIGKNTVTATIISDIPLQPTKISWKLSADRKQYTFEFNTNTKYPTTVTDILGNVIPVEIDIKIIDDKPAKLTVDYKYKTETNTVLVTVKSDKELQETKKSWKLSADKKQYTFEFDGNTTYTTSFTDIYGNIINVPIEITKIVEVTYEYKPYTNTVVATIKSSFELQDTKVSWKISDDKKQYAFEFDENTTYITNVTDMSGNIIPVKINVTQVKPTDILLIDESKYPGYKALLKQLQAKHPNWIFKLKYTGLDWNTAVNSQDVVIDGSPKSLTQYSNQWRNGNQQYGTGWYRASRSAIAYMMDPRNSLDESYIFQFQNLTSTVGNYSDIANMISGTFLTKYQTSSTDSIINAILRAANTYKVSPFHIVSRMIQEQGRGGGSLNGYKYNGKTVYNLFNIGATGNSDPEIIANGAAYAFDKKWFTPEDCIIESTNFLNTNYFKRGQSTLYFQKYNVVEIGNFYNHQYMQNIRAANDEGYTTYKSYRDNGLLDCQFEFVIPVYENMPLTACPRPSGTL